MNHDITRIVAVSGSLQARSKNLALLTTAAHVAPPRVDFVLFDGIRDLPHFNPDLEASAVPSRIGLRVWTASADGQKVMVMEEFGKRDRTSADADAELDRGNQEVAVTSREYIAAVNGTPFVKCTKLLA